MDAGSGGWSFPSPNQVKAIDTLAPIQLYHIKEDSAETTNLQASQLEQVTNLKQLLTTQINNGRSNPGPPQANDTFKGAWKQVDFIN